MLCKNYFCVWIISYYCSHVPIRAGQDRVDNTLGLTYNNFAYLFLCMFLDIFGYKEITSQWKRIPDRLEMIDKMFLSCIKINFHACLSITTSMGSYPCIQDDTDNSTNKLLVLWESFVLLESILVVQVLYTPFYYRVYPRSNNDSH